MDPYGLKCNPSQPAILTPEQYHTMHSIYENGEWDGDEYNGWTFHPHVSAPLPARQYAYADKQVPAEVTIMLSPNDNSYIYEYEHEVILESNDEPIDALNNVVKKITHNIDELYLLVNELGPGQLASNLESGKIDSLKYNSLQILIENLSEHMINVNKEVNKKIHSK
tara:strand:- start:316 stop:816 length:501 start_codon:yes stop_codon:yes gene_type:complete